MGDHGPVNGTDDTSATVPLPTRRAVLLPPVDPATATGLLQATGCGGWLVPEPGGATVFTGEVLSAGALARALGHGAGRPDGVLLWADPSGPEAGFVLLHRGDVVTAHSWTTSGAGELGEPALAARATGRPGVEPALRDLLARPAADPLAHLPELADLFGVPAAVLPLLTAAALPTGSVRVPVAPRRPGRLRSLLGGVRRR
ncbi:hypothetical protein JD78_01704 [Modestobacter roseus]|uniref:Uncharacterized protein n=1 Tax=Modestobacter roseus TaxID=1181884 RepID=A0A562IQB0_9ACTN|nr:hypothetical protein JD78_01704 [Modestobacter roseus]